MSNYEFWDELGKIFNAVVAYQEKTIEFNKRFINPWIRLGNVFDKQDRNEEAICAYQKAIEIDPNNAQNWYESGNIHFRMEKFEDAIADFQHAIDLDPGFGSPYSNLALTLVTQGNFTEAIPLYRKSIELLVEDKDKAEAWNRLGNLYRKLDEYDLAVESFHNADELDRDNSGFRDSLDEVPADPTLVEANSAGDGPAVPVTVSLDELISAETQREEAVPENTDETAPVLIASTDVPTQPIQVIAVVTETLDAIPTEVQVEAPLEVENPVADSQPVELEPQAVEISADPIVEPANLPQVEQPILAVDAVVEIAVEPVVDDAPVAVAASPEPAVDITSVVVASVEPVVDAPSEPVTEPVVEPAAVENADETVSVVVQNTIETFTETVTVTNTTTETTDAALTVEASADVVVEPVVDVVEVAVENVEKVDDLPASEPEAADSSEAAVAETIPADIGSDDVAAPVALDAPEIQAEVVEPVVVEPAVVEPVVVEIASIENETVTVDTVVTETNIVVETTVTTANQQPAYEEYLKDSNDPITKYQTEGAEKADENVNPQVSDEPIAKINDCGELQIEMDTKNAHVWNELGNVYFNTRAFDDAVIAYSKAIELDRWFAWPYSNLALTYVQKGRFVEAILLYQRSIELFASDKDKAVSWNRLGNVYRRINDYENAIASYQRADELDPDNTTLSLQSRFSLLGSYVMEQKPSYVS